ncbi:transcriptional regulator PpsR [Acidisoma cladoniae]|uniref:transcriptional regulator PpsR n=1 Tax=Acidisoma cladoniae TaxID=3040935 RepID=UPI00254B3A41|nr:transcriptional regulator PpsR [Acidisoma sp. PAMC 29798]
MRASKWFSRDNGSIGPLSAEEASRVLAAAADIALIVGPDGIVQDCAFRTSELEDAVEDAGSWAGQRWTETVTVESRQKAEALLDGALKDAEPLLRHLNHPAALDGPDIAIEYSAVRANSDGSVVAFGRDLRRLASLQQRLVDAQQALERDYASLRQAQARYRGLFQTAPEPLMVADAQSMRVTEANPAALKLIEQGRRSLGVLVVDLLHADDRPAAQRMLAGMRQAGGPQSMAVRLNPDSSDKAGGDKAGGAKSDPDASVTLGVTMLMEEKSAVLVLRLSNATASKANSSSDVNQRLLSALEQAPDGFVLTSQDGDVLNANAAFIGMAQLGSLALAQGRSIENWIGQSGIDTDVLLANLKQRGVVRLFATSIRGEMGGMNDVEISANAVMLDGQQCFGFVIRDIGRRLTTARAQPVRAMPRSIEQLTELIGRVSMKELVRDAIDVIERLCIESALELTGNNRASAAEMLGLSRQSLYVKLRRYGLSDPGDGEPDNEAGA